MAEIVMPRLSDTMEEGTILRWLKTDGDHVARGEELVEIETDKATMTYESDQEGALEIVADVGSTLEVGALIARVGATASSEAQPTATAPGDALARSTMETGGRVKASPLARRIAGDSGVDLRALTGSGPGGRIVKADVLAGAAAAGATATPAGEAPAGAAPDQGATAATATAAAGAPPPGLESVTTAKGETTTVELSRTQQTIARRMAESKATIPDFTLQIDVDMEECVKLRAQLKQISQHERDPAAPGASEQLKAPTYNDMVMKACALALREHPTANGSYRDGRLQLHSRVNVGVAVAAENALVVPTVFDADSKALGEIARETHTLSDRVRSGAITPPELGGGTFTVSNLGMYGIKNFTAIINPPQAGILSVGVLAPRAVLHDGELTARNTMTLTLSCDHRVLYGAEAARFLARVRELLESPAALTL
ncbi:MAG TPA: dihydrolipoamide acetyltransferase family protein [Solirubrobacteraceae bacterium]|jgi:pyruvate dehydrogenase E2 component (dihydrolipoamide acetyltransferase)|nr:dihydrolipoamide acetyltransferase family protein [Solirubrobacteraceae bacterium]